MKHNASFLGWFFFNLLFLRGWQSGRIYYNNWSFCSDFWLVFIVRKVHLVREYFNLLIFERGEKDYGRKSRTRSP